MCRPTNRSRAAGPGIWFRIIHAALHGQDGAPLASYREQAVEVALGPMGIVEDGHVGILTRRIEADEVVSIVPLTRGNLKSPKGPKTPRVTELLRKATEWQALLKSGEIATQADIARKEGITRTRVTQIMGLLRLTPEIQEKIHVLPETSGPSTVSERNLRPILAIAERRD